MGTNLITSSTLNKEGLGGNSISSNYNQSHSKSPGMMKGSSYGNYAEMNEPSGSNLGTGGRSGKNTKAQIRGVVNNNYIQIEAL